MLFLNTFKTSTNFFIPTTLSFKIIKRQMMLLRNLRTKTFISKSITFNFILKSHNNNAMNPRNNSILNVPSLTSELPIALIEPRKTNKIVSELMSISSQEYNYLTEDIATLEELKYNSTLKIEFYMFYYFLEVKILNHFLYNKKTFVSGLKSFTEKEWLQIKLNQNSIVETMLYIYAKTLISFCLHEIEINDSTNNLLQFHQQGLERSIKKINKKDLDHEFLNLLGNDIQNLAPYLKHFDTVFKAGCTYPKKIASVLNDDLISLDFFEEKINAPIFRELYILGKALVPLKNKFGLIKGYLVNPENVENLPGFSIQKSLEQTKQKFGDFCFTDGKDFIKILDEKASSNRPLGRISIMLDLFEDPSLIRQSIQNLKGVLNLYLKKEPKTKATIKKYLYEITLIENAKITTNLDLRAKVLSFIRLSSDIFLDPILPELNVSIFLPSEKDSNFLQDIEKVKGIVEKITREITEDNLKELFPKNSSIKISFWREISTKIIEGSDFSAKQKSCMLENYEKFVIEFYDKNVF